MTFLFYQDTNKGSTTLTSQFSQCIRLYLSELITLGRGSPVWEIDKTEDDIRVTSRIPDPVLFTIKV